ncbi:MAG: Zn-dependent alcohol dehydrogenase [Rhodospirillaceae bacterium]|jgi:S-(hydroxymethyl)glutathione dehydrogenase / alcohol dehydrogenase|nr:Zn-dependent alcohol dehydrogenase [Rhodospirillaceae bacterium]MBT6138688.1 Zn-dependent alcohol dehydrogenase [Rhodospirillaceae bacterium]
MKAAVCRAFGRPLEIEDLEIQAPGPGEVMVRVSATAICHSDISYIDGLWGGDLPTVYGHEAAGTIEGIGVDVASLKTGQPVVVTLIRSCGQCQFCRDDLPALCEASFALDEHGPLRAANGETVIQGLRTGAFAEYVVVDASQVTALPDDLPLDLASLLACGVLTGWGAVVNSAKLKAGSNVAVIGTGGVGLNSVQAAAWAGASTIAAVDLSDSKIAAAKDFGATHGINPAQVDAVEVGKSLTGGRGFDCVLITVGAGPAVEQGLAMLARGGDLVLVGMPANGVLSTFDPGTIANEGQRLLGSKMGSGAPTRDIPLLVDLYQRGTLKLEPLVSGRYRLDEINEAIASVKRGEALRNVIVFDGRDISGNAQ